MKFPQKPKRGQKVLQSIYDSLNEVIDYIPSLQIKGDNKTTSVSHSSTGTTIHANVKTPAIPQSKEGTEYIAGSGIQILSGNVLNAAIDNSTIKFGVKNGQYVLSCTLSGGGGGGSDTNDTYIGDANYYSNLSGNHIYISPDADYNGSHLVSSTLNWLQELNNNKFCESGRVRFPTTAHVITSDIELNTDHCIVPGDLIHDGLGTTVNYSWMRSPFGDDPDAMVGLVDGLQVDLTLSGGKYADVVLYQNKGGYGTVSHEVEPPTESTINVLLSGDGQIDPTTGHIFIRDIANDNGTSGGIIYTNLHAGNNVTIDPDGAINATGGGGGPDTNTEYIGDKNVDLSGHIWVNQTGSSPRLISSDLVHIDDLLNYPLSGDGNHFVQVNNLKDGAGTSIDFHWNSKGDHTEDGGGPDTLIKFVDGVCVNLNVSGGTYVTTKFHQGVGYGDYSSASIDCNLSGDRDINNSGLITIVPQYDIEQNITGGIISSVLHAGSGITIDSTGEISTTGGGGSNIPTPEAGKILSCDNNGMTWQPNTGGGGGPVTYVSGFYPNWGHGNHDSVVIPSNDSYSAPPFTMAQNGWIYAWASFNPSYDGFRYSSYRAHVIVGGAWFKVCELLLPFQKAELTLSSSNNVASLVPNGNYARYPEGDVTDKFYLSGMYYDQQKEENVDFMVQCTRSEENDQYETLYDGNDDQSGRNYTKFAWSVSNRPTENLPNVLYTNDQFITSNSYYDIYYKDQNDDFQPLYYLDGISNTMGKKSEDYTYFAWKSNNDIVFSRRYGTMHQNIGAPTEYSISTLIYNYQNYIGYQETPLTSNRINFQNITSGGTIGDNDPYFVKATASNVSDIAIGVGAAITIPARKGKSVQFKVETDNNGTYSVPISYGQQYGGGPYPVACVVYYDDPPEE